MTSSILGVTESPMVRIATVAESMPGSLKLCYGESDMPTPDFICRAVGEAARSGHTFYTHTAGCPELREAIATQVHALQGVTYRPSEVMATVGATMAAFVAIRAFVGPGDNAVVLTPAYALFTNGVVLCGGEPRPVPLAPNGRGFSLDLDRVRASIDANTRMLVINSPSNPTGWMASLDEQRALADLAERHSLVILSDEVYERLTYDGPVAPSFARVVHNRDRLVVINSFSKTYNMTGWRLGWAQASEPVIKAMYRAAEFITSNPAAMVQQAGIAALRAGEDYVRDLRAHYAARRAQVMAALASMPGVSLPEPQGAFYAFPRIDAAAGDPAAFADALLRETGVALAPGTAFGRGGEGHIRICFASTEATIGEALGRLGRYLAALRA